VSVSWNAASNRWVVCGKRGVLHVGGNNLRVRGLACRAISAFADVAAATLNEPEVRLGELAHRLLFEHVHLSPLVVTEYQLAQVGGRGGELFGVVAARVD